MEYIVFQLSVKENFVNGYAYSSVPAGNNVAGTSWSQVTVEYVTEQNGSTTSQAPALPSAVSQADLDSGSLFEWPFTVEVDANASNQDKQTALENDLAALETETLADLQSRLRFWGHEGTA